LTTLKQTYTSFEVIMKKDWFVPDDIANKSDIFLPLIENGVIDCQKKYGKWLWSTYIYRALNKD
jgi:hypothetical protein